MLNYREREVPVTVPTDLRELEEDFQRVLYVEDRLSRIGNLPKDRLDLKNRLLASLTPQSVRKSMEQKMCDLTQDYNLQLKIHDSDMKSCREREDELLQRIDLLEQQLLSLDQEPLELPRKELNGYPLFSYVRQHKLRIILIVIVAVVTIYLNMR